MITVLVILIFVIAILAQRPATQAASDHYDAALEDGDATHAAAGCVWTTVALGIGLAALMALMAVASMVPPRG